MAAREMTPPGVIHKVLSLLRAPHRVEMRKRFGTMGDEYRIALTEIAKLIAETKPEDGKRSLNQNDLAFKWYQEIAEQKGDETPTEIRAFCKLTFGVEIRRKDEAFRRKYDEILKPLPIPAKLALMVEPFDLPVTRDMGKKEMTAYLDAMNAYWTGRGINLTIPEDA